MKKEIQAALRKQKAPAHVARKPPSKPDTGTTKPKAPKPETKE
ncbi:MAG: hypothetical protein ACOC0Q_07260 [Wenzhouxiangella sp.]